MTLTPEPSSGPPAIEDLVALFFEDSEPIGTVAEKSVEDVPDSYTKLLAHNGHMTETVEQFFHGPVAVQVLDRRFDQPYYSREIILRRNDDKKVVQYGIVRLDVTFLEDNVCEEILAEQIPLGRILINHNVMREVQLSALWEIETGNRLSDIFSCPQGTVTYGRTAMILLDGDPVIELLEIIAPLESL